MNDFKFVSEKYSIKNTQDYRLSIQVNPDGFSLLILDKEGNIITIIHRQTGSVTNTRHLFKQEEELIKFRELSFRSSSLLINSSKVSLAPPEIDVDADMLMHIQFGSLRKNKLERKATKDKQINYCFVIDQDLNNLFSDFRNHPVIEHLTGSFLDYIFSVHKHDKNACYIYTSPSICHFARLDKTTLQYYNLYRVRNDEEFLYHFVNTLDKLQLESDSEEVYYSGHIVKTDEIWKIMSGYHKNIITLPNEFDFELAGDMNENYFSYLFKTISENYQW